MDTVLASSTDALDVRLCFLAVRGCVVGPTTSFSFPQWLCCLGIYHTLRLDVRADRLSHFLVAAWRQVDFYVKMSAPWMELQSIGGDKTMLAMVLVDEYISLLAYQVLFKAFRRRHWTVLTTATCQLLLQALVRY